MKIKPVHIDGILYVLIAVFGSVQAMMQSDETYKYMPGIAVFYIKFLSAVSLAACGALKMYRSSSYADHVRENKSVDDNKEAGKIQP